MRVVTRGEPVRKDRTSEPEAVFGRLNPGRRGRLGCFIGRKLCDAAKTPMNPVAPSRRRILKAHLSARGPWRGPGRRMEPMQQQQQGTKGTGQIRTLSLVKGNQQFCFRYEVGEESKVLESLIEM